LQVRARARQRTSGDGHNRVTIGEDRGNDDVTGAPEPSRPETSAFGEPWGKRRWLAYRIRAGMLMTRLHHARSSRHQAEPAIEDNPTYSAPGNG